ncbi:MAG: GNAT family N-acetyltransferase [Spirochaetia bacterium]|nr:GNAT family N-acetyltransferase [Spirochaetia bacterium]
MFFIKIKPENMAGINILIALDAQIFDIPWSESQWRAEIENPVNEVFVISGDEELLFPAGFLSYGISGDAIELKKIGILGPYRKQKVASAALEKLIQDSLNENMCNIISEVAATNLPAIRLYENFGFYKIHVRKKYYNNLVDAIVMQREI